MRFCPFQQMFLAALLVCLTAMSPHGTAGAPLSEASIAKLQKLEAVVSSHIAEMEKQTTPSPALEKYRLEYLKAIPHLPLRRVPDAELAERLAASPMVLLGDNHTTARSQENTVQVLTLMAKGPRPLTLVIEWIDITFQKEVDRFLAGHLPLTDLRKAISYNSLWGFPWKGYSQILSTAKKLRVPVLLVERLKGRHSLTDRDTFITKCLNTHRHANPTSRYLVVYGDYHLLGANHLSEQFMKAGFTRQTVLFGDSDTTYWRALKQFKDPSMIGVLALGPDLFFICNGTPWERQLSYRAYLMKLLDYSEDDFENWVDAPAFSALLGASSPSPQAAFEALHTIPRRP
jgi:hypothetical protein